MHAHAPFPQTCFVGCEHVGAPLTARHEAKNCSGLFACESHATVLFLVTHFVSVAVAQSALHFAMHVCISSDFWQWSTHFVRFFFPFAMHRSTQPGLSQTQKPSLQRGFDPFFVQFRFLQSAFALHVAESASWN